MGKIFLFWTFLVLLIVFRYLTTRHIYKEGDRIRITTKISSESRRSSSYQSVEVASLVVYLPPTPPVGYGDEIVVEGVVKEKKLEDAKLISVKETTSFIPKIRENIINFYKTTVPEPHSSLVAGVTIGAKSSLPKDFWEKLKTTGTLHVVVASGMNVTMIAKFLLLFFVIFLPRKRAIPLSILGILGYLTLSGFDPPLIRAAIMGTLTFIGEELGRVVSAWRILFLSALSMLVVVPDWLFDLGFILSFVATASLLIFEAKIRGKLSFLPGFFKEGFSTALAAQIGVTPILFVTFGQFNILSPIINALVTWTVPFIMIIGGIGAVIGLLIPEIGKLILYLGYPLTWWFINIIEIFG